MAVGFVSSPAFGHELVELRLSEIRELPHLRSLKLTVLLEFLRSLDPLRSLVLPDLLLSSSFGTDLWLRWLRAKEVLQFLLHLGRLEPRSFDKLLGLLVLFSRLLLILISLLLQSSLNGHRHLSYSFSISEDSVNNGRSNEGRLDDESGRFIFLSVGGGIEEPEGRAGETPRPSIIISRGTDGRVQSVMVPFLRPEDVKLDNQETIFRNFYLGYVLVTISLFLPLLNQINDDPSIDLSQILETNLELRQHDLPSLDNNSVRLNLNFLPHGGIEVRTAGETPGPSTVISCWPQLSTVISFGSNDLRPSLSNAERYFNSLADGSIEVCLGGENPRVISLRTERHRRLAESSRVQQLRQQDVDLHSLDNDSGSNEARLNFLLDGGIEEPERLTGEAPGPSTVISHGTDGLERCFQSVIVQRLRQEDVNLENLDTILGSFELDLRTNPSSIAQIERIIKNMRIDLLRMRETNPTMSLEEFKVCCVPICWSSTKRLEFFCRLSDTLVRAIAPDQPDELKDLLGELENEKPLVFDGKWINRIHREWIDKIDPNFRPCKTSYRSLGGLLRFVRNRWRHPDEFKEFFGSDSAEDFYNYFDQLFPNLLMVSYSAACRFCRERWFKDYR